MYDRADTISALKRLKVEIGSLACLGCGYEHTYDDFGCHSVVRFGKYEQDGSCGEYDSTDCIGWYVEVYGLICPDWAEDEPMYFNDYLRQQNLLEVIFKCEVIGNIHDNPELLKGGEG